jgi:predicted DNA-binding protein
MVKTFIVRISSKFQERLERLAGKTKMPPSFHIEEMLEIFFDEYEEACIAKERISMQNARYHTSKTVRKLLDL